MNMLPVQIRERAIHVEDVHGKMRGLIDRDRVKSHKC